MLSTQQETASLGGSSHVNDAEGSTSTSIRRGPQYNKPFSAYGSPDDETNDGKLSSLLSDSRAIMRRNAPFFSSPSNTFGRRESMSSVTSSRRTKIRLMNLRPEDIMRARSVYEASRQPPVFTVFHVTTLLTAFGVNSIPSPREVEKAMLKTTFAQLQQQRPPPISPAGTAANTAATSADEALGFETFLEVLELLKRAHTRQAVKEDECFECFEALNYRYRTEYSRRKNSMMTDEGSVGRLSSKVMTTIPLPHLQQLATNAGIEYDFDVLLTAVDTKFDGNVTPTQFRWCAGTEDPTIVSAFVALGGEASLSGTIPNEVLISRCQAMGMTTQYVANFVAEIDVNNDGVVDYSEFLSMIVRHRESKELKRSWSTGAKSFRIPSRSRFDSITTEAGEEEKGGGGEGGFGDPYRGGASLGIQPFPRRAPFRRESQVENPNFPGQLTASARNSLAASPPPIAAVETEIHLDDETNFSETTYSNDGSDREKSGSSSSDGGDGSESSYDAADVLGATTRAVVQLQKQREDRERERHRGGRFKIDIDGLVGKKHRHSHQEKTPTEKIQDITAKCRSTIQVQRGKVGKYLGTDAKIPVKKIVTERDGLVDVSTEKGRNQIKYYFGVKKRLPPKFSKVSPRLTAHPQHVTERLLLEAQLAMEPPPLKEESRAPKPQAIAPLLVAAAAAACYITHTMLEAMPSKTDPVDTLFKHILQRPIGAGTRTPHKPSPQSTAAAGRKTPQRPLSARRFQSSPSAGRQRHLEATTARSGVVGGGGSGFHQDFHMQLLEELNLDSVVLDSLTSAGGGTPTPSRSGSVTSSAASTNLSSNSAAKCRGKSGGGGAHLVPAPPSSSSRSHSQGSEEEAHDDLAHLLPRAEAEEQRGEEAHDATEQRYTPFDQEEASLDHPIAAIDTSAGV